MLKVALFASAVSAGNLNGDRVLRLKHEEGQLSALQTEKARNLISTMDVWGTSEDGSLEVRVPESMVDTFKVLGFNVSDSTDEHEAHFKWFADNFDMQVCTKSNEECAKGADFYDQYQRYGAITTYVGDLANKFSTVTTRTWGNSYEGRAQTGAKVTGTASAGKQVVFYFCGEHAREWLPPMFCTYMIETLATRYEAGDENIVKLMNKYEFHILPVMNPDGYEFSMTNNNMWRKSRKPNTGSSCIGTDLNRNYGFQWNTGGSSSDKCSDVYHGTASFDNVETANMEDYAKNTNIIVQTDVHAYGRMWMHPWGYTTRLSNDDPKMQAAGTATVQAIRAVHGQQFVSGSIANVIYVASGSSCDYFYGAHGTIFAYAPEVRGTSFQPPASNIKPSNEELFAGMLAQVNYADQHP